MIWFGTKPSYFSAIKSYQIKRYELDNYEADDIIGTLSKEADQSGFQTIIVTGDRDLTQLATDNVTIYYTKKGVTDVDHYTYSDLHLSRLFSYNKL